MQRLNPLLQGALLLLVGMRHRLQLLLPLLGLLLLELCCDLLLGVLDALVEGLLHRFVFARRSSRLPAAARCLRIRHRCRRDLR